MVMSSKSDYSTLVSPTEEQLRVALPEKGQIEPNIHPPQVMFELRC
jgi:hypothetical protein